MCLCLCVPKCVCEGSRAPLDATLQRGVQFTWSEVRVSWRVASQLAVAEAAREIAAAAATAAASAVSCLIPQHSPQSGSLQHRRYQSG